MPTLFRPVKRVPLPPAAEVRQKAGRAVVRVEVRGRQTDCAVTACGRFYLRPDPVYVADVRDADGKRHRVRLASTEAASHLMLAEIVKRVELDRAGVSAPPAAAHARTPVADHLADWRASLAAAGRPPEYLDRKLSRVEKALAACRFVRVADFDAVGLEQHLHAGRAAGRSVQTSNDDLQACRQFTRWLVANGRLDRDPFARLKKQNAELDRRRVRGELEPAERAALVSTAFASAAAFRGLSGADRAMLYRVALATGFRAGELAKLTPGSFDLAAAGPTASLPATATKNGKAARQPLPPGLAAALAEYLTGRPAGAAVWPGSWAKRSADMLAADLSAAGVPVEVPDPDGGRIVRDFHALRNAYISDVIRTGADLKQSMTLARHADPRLTAGRYARTRSADLAAVARALPDPGPAQHGRSTGAADARDGAGNVGTHRDAGTLPGVGRELTTGTNETLEKPGFRDGPGPAGTCHQAERAGFEPTVGVTLRGFSKAVL